MDNRCIILTKRYKVCKNKFYKNGCCRRHFNDEFELKFKLLKEIKEYQKNYVPKLHDELLKNIKEHDNFQLSRVKQLLTLDQPAQRSEEWFEIRKSRITASEYSSCIKYDEYLQNLMKNNILKINKSLKLNAPSCSSYKSRIRFLGIKSGIIESPFTNNKYCEWGKKYEEIATRIYQHLYNVKVYEFGLLQHPHIDFLAASPDGISEDGIMLEIKCPFTDRDIGAPKIDYWMQMQLQMEVANLHYCDFLDMRIREYSREQYMNDNVSTYKGLILIIRKGNQSSLSDNYWNNEFNYFYPDFQKTEDEQIDEINRFIKEEIIEKKVELNKFIFGEYQAMIKYWYVEDYRNTRIARDKWWFYVYALPQLKEAHKLIKYYKDNPTKFKGKIPQQKDKIQLPTSYGKCILLSSSDDE